MNDATAPLLVQYAMCPGPGYTPHTDEVLTIVPPPRSFMAGIAARHR